MATPPQSSPDPTSTTPPQFQAHHGSAAQGHPLHHARLVDHVAARNWKEVWKELAPYHSDFVVACDADDASLAAFRHTLTRPHPLRSSGAFTSVLDLVVNDGSDRVPTLIVEALLAIGVDVEARSSTWLRQDYNPAKRAMFMACVRTRPDRGFTRPIAGRSYLNDDDLAAIMRQSGNLGEGWSSLSDLLAEGKWFAVRNRMRRGVIEEDEFRKKACASTGKTCQQFFIERADRPIQVELAYRYPHLFKDLAHYHRHHMFHRHDHQHLQLQHLQHTFHHEPMQLAPANVTRPHDSAHPAHLRNHQPPEPPRQPPLVSEQLRTSPASPDATGVVPPASGTAGLRVPTLPAVVSGGRLRRISSERSTNGEEEELEAELNDIKRRLMDLDRKIDSERALYSSKERILSGKIADLASQVSGMMKSMKHKEMKDEEEREDTRRRLDSAVAAEVAAAVDKAKKCLDTAIAEISARLEAKLDDLGGRMNRLEIAMSLPSPSSDQD